MILPSSILGANLDSPALQLLNQCLGRGMVHVEDNDGQVWKLPDLPLADVRNIEVLAVLKVFVEVHPLGVDLVIHIQFLPYIEFHDALRQGTGYLQLLEEVIRPLDIWFQPADGLFL